MKLFRQELMCIIGVNDVCKLHPVKTPSLCHMSPSSPLPPLPGHVGKEFFGWGKRSAPIRQICKRNKFPYAWILITHMWIINMSHESKWSTHVCKWAIHRDYSHRNLWRPNLAVAEVNSNISINIIMLWICQAHNKILHFFSLQESISQTPNSLSVSPSYGYPNPSFQKWWFHQFLSKCTHSYQCYLKQLILEAGPSKPTPCANPSGYLFKTATSAQENSQINSL